ncbi:MAG: UbiD family decarboxylase [Thermodesulfobacteriota bacterium]
MPFQDLREFIDRLDKEGELARVKVEVDPKYEIGVIMRKVFDQRGKAVLFENVAGHHMPLLCGAMDTYNRYALGIGSPPEVRAILEKTVAAARHPLPPVLVNDAPCQERVLTGEEVNLYDFPVPLWHHLDPGPFIGTLGNVITKDPETGKHNAGIYRQQIQGKNKTGLLATQQVGVILQKYLDAGRPMPVATVIGPNPAMLASSCFHLPLGEDEFSAAGALMGEPLKMVKCKTIDLEVPAHAEIVLEGEIPCDKSQWEMEGPFGEFTGYYGGVVGKKPSIILKAITSRADPIFQATMEGKPPSESTTLRTIGHSTGAWIKLEKAKVPGFKRAYFSDMGCAVFMLIIALEKQYYQGNARQAIMAHWSMSHVGKWVIVVDDDIDIFDRAQVEWALATRVQPHRDIIITDNLQPGTNLDPSIHPDDRPFPATRCSRIGIDATKQFKGFDFPPEIKSRPEDVEKVESRWKEYGLD